MFNWIKNKWKTYSNLGVNDKMTISLQKKVILSNQMALFLFILLISMNTIQLFINKFTLITFLSFLSIFTLLIVPIMNKKGGHHTSAFLLSILTPFFSFIFSTIIDGQVSIINYFTPRIFLLTMIAIPFIIIDKSKKILIIIAVVFIIGLSFSLDLFLKIKGYAFDPQKINFGDYYQINYFMVFAFIIILFSLYFLTNINLKYENRILNLVNDLKNTNDELEQQKLTIEKAFNTIEIKNKKITDSIEYARKIQIAFLPDNDQIKNTITDYFILYIPKDIVSGDFFWINKINDKKIIIAADCTGHGVPGAFLSVLGVTLINNILKKNNNISTSSLLNRLRILIKNTLKQNKNFNEQKDGMDISTCFIQDKKMQYSGAYNSVYIIRNNELIELKADRQPIGFHIVEKNFTKKEINLQKNDTIYLFSDGYLSQFGGKDNDKLSSKRFKNLLLDISKNNINKQKYLLKNFFLDWKGDNEQLDDILIIGFKPLK